MPSNERLCLKNFPVRASILALAPLTCLLLSSTALHAEPRGRSAAKEQARRADNAAQAHTLLESGDESYQAGKWQEAVESYAKARDLLGNAPATEELRDAATERYVLASVEYSKDLSRKGDVAGAKVAIERVLSKAVAPDHPAALSQLAKLNDPIRTNPALTKEHAADMEEVRLLLYKAQGAYDLGKYDEAKTVYQNVLRTDPYNKAARRGMELVNQAQHEYFNSAYDQTRADMLSQVGEAWENKVQPKSSVPELEVGPRGDAGQVMQAAKLKQIIIPSIDLDRVTLEEAVDYLRSLATRYDTISLDPAQKGVNFVVALGPPDSDVVKSIQAQKITLQLKNIPLGDALKYINDVTHTTYSAQEFAVTISAIGSASTGIISRSFQTPPGFMSAGGGETSTSDAGGDVFSGAKPEGLAAKSLSAEEVLRGKGVPFPDGSSASYNRGTSTLTVRNTAENLMVVDQVLTQMTETAPAAVVIEVRILRTKEVHTKELGWDWFLGEFSLHRSGLDNTLLTGGNNDGSITSGNRSGNFAIEGNSLDQLIETSSAGFSPPSNRAPSALNIFGRLNNADFSLLMRGLNQKKNTSLAACPSVTVNSGQAAKVQISRGLIYPTEYEPPQLPNSVLPNNITDNNGNIIDQTSSGVPPVTPSHPTSFETREVGVLLDVLPTASADHNFIDLALEPNVTDFDGFVNFGTPIMSGDQVATRNEILMPVFSKVGLKTNVTIANGATLVLGGMLQEKVQKTQDHTPILGNLPLVGRLFQDEAYQPERTAVVILVTARVVDPGGHPLGNNN